MPTSCERGRIYGIPDTISATRGTVLSPSVYADAMSGVAAAIAIARSEGLVYAADNLEHWQNGTGSIKYMPVRPFFDPLNRLDEMFIDKHIPAFERGIASRVRNRSHPQGPLLPAGTTRFLQFRDGIRPRITAGGFPIRANDIGIATGAYQCHSVMWVRARRSGSRYRVDILRWCAQIFDSYDWNVGGIPLTDIPVSDSTYASLPSSVRSRVVNYGAIRTIRVDDEEMRDIEVTGTPRSYLVYTEPFEVPSRIWSSRHLMV
jgi:hypothetical protein